MLRLDEIHIRDPFVLLEDGTYYLYGTRGATCWGEADGFDVYRSRDLAVWEGPFVCFQRPEGFWADRNYWAPEVHFYDGAYYMFASFKSEDRCRQTLILRAESPMGPFRVHSVEPITPPDWECLDGTFYVSKEGVPHMVFCHEWVQVGDGEIWARPLKKDLTGPAGEPFLLFKASSAPWAKWITASGGRKGCVTDGPFLVRVSPEKLYCLWASFSETGYTEGLAVSENGEIDGRFVQIDPLFKEDGGHAMVFKDREGAYLLALHSPNMSPNERPRFVPLKVEDGLLKG